MRFNPACLCLAFSLWMLGLTVPASAQQDKTDPAQGKVVDLYILSGQSNMQGSGVVSELADAWQQPIEGAYIVQQGKIKTMQASKHQGPKRFGPELGFAHYMRNNQPDRPEIYLIKFAISGQPLDAGWNGGSADGSSWAGPEPGPNRKTFYPGLKPDDPNIGLHYKSLKAHVDKVIKVLVNNGLQPKLRGIVWMQGEQDAKNEVSADRYDKSLALLKKRMEQDFADGKNVPFVFGQVLPYEPAMKRFSHRELIRKRMAEADNRSESDRAIDNIWMVSTDGMDLNKDTVHYSTKGQLELGQAFGLEMLKAHRAADQQAMLEMQEQAEQAQANPPKDRPGKTRSPDPTKLVGD